MGRLRGCIWLTAGLVVALLAGIVGFIVLSRATATPTAGETTPAVGAPQVSVVVAARAVTVRSAITAEDVTLRELPVDALPEGAVRRVEDALGRITLTDLYAGEVLLSQRLVDPTLVTAGGRFALLLAEEEVLMAVPAADLMSRITVLKPGDQIDVLFSLDFPRSTDAEAGTTNEEQATFQLLQNLTIAAIVGGEAGAAPQALLLTLEPQDALVLKYMIDAGGIVDLVLRAPGVDTPFETEPVDIDYVIDRYRIPVPAGARTLPAGTTGR